MCCAGQIEAATRSQLLHFAPAALLVTGGVAMNIALWKYMVEPAGEGTRLTEYYELRTLPPTMVDGGQAAIDERIATNTESMQATLAGIKAAAES